ncbi:MAG: hypothetical protein IH594_08450 [Bacteroidales bacterium]|nr:hypothetical protein [Bacteroidales bacterium]
MNKLFIPAMTTFGEGNHALRDQRWRYVRWCDGSEEFYDHENDPNEWNNLAGHHGHKAVKKHMASYLPEKERISAQTDHLLQVRITKKGTSVWFNPIRPTFRGQPVAVKAQIGSKISDGVFLQHGGQACCYALYIKDGCLCMSIMDVTEPLHWKTMTTTLTINRSTQPLSKVAQTVEGRLSRKVLITLYVNGKEVGRQKAGTLSLHPYGQMAMGEAPPA